MFFPPEIRHGDCFEIMATMPEASVDAIVTDPPYGLEFMGKEWDRFLVDARSARWASRSGAAGNFGVSVFGAVLPSYTRRRTTSQCRTCGKRDAFRNQHECDETGVADWATIYVDQVPVELREFQNWCSEWGALAYRVLKPGGHILAFGGARTYHRLTCGLEDVGFDIRDCLMWLYGQGFPKSLSVLIAIAKRFDPNWEAGLPLPPEAEQWQGWGTALKPAFEPIVLARKPLVGTVAENVIRYGVGGLNVDGCRVGFASAEDEAETKEKNRHGDFKSGPRENLVFGEDNRARAERGNYDSPGRWPANVILDEAAAALLDEQAGELAGAGNVRLRGDVPPEEQYREADPGSVFQMRGGSLPSVVHDQGGGASRFFYTAKASRGEREEGLEGLEPRRRGDVTGREEGSAGSAHARAGVTAQGDIRNTHPTVKPVDLMRWIVRLVAPAGALVLDPFLGSGTTLIAAWEESCRAIGIEREQEYVTIARARLAEATRQGRLF